jgi:hypothetical protein
MIKAKINEMSFSDLFLQAQNAGSSLNKYMIKYTIIFLIFLLGSIISRFLGKVVRKAFSQIKYDQIILKSKKKIRISTIAGTSIEFLGYFFTFLTAINELRPSNDLPVFIIIFIVIALAVSITLAVFAAKKK